MLLLGEHHELEIFAGNETFEAVIVVVVVVVVPAIVVI